MRVLKIAEVAERIGMSPDTVRTWKSRAPHRTPPTRQLPSGGRVWIDEDVDAWLAGLPITSQPTVTEDTAMTAVKRGPGRPRKIQRAGGREMKTSLDYLSRKTVLEVPHHG